MKRALLWISALAGVCAPLAVAFGAMGSDLGWVSFETGFWFLTLTVAWWLAIAGVTLGLAAAVVNRTALERAWPWLVAGLAVPALTLGGLWMLNTRLDALVPVVETSTDWRDPPGFSRLLMARRGDIPVSVQTVIPPERAMRRQAWAEWAGRTSGEAAAACPGAHTIPRLVESEDVVVALEAEGVRVVGQSPWRVEGFRESVFYGRVRDVVVRIEPGATDIRVSERVGDVDFGDTCALATALVERITASR